MLAVHLFLGGNVLPVQFILLCTLCHGLKLLGFILNIGPRIDPPKNSVIPEFGFSCGRFIACQSLEVSGRARLLKIFSDSVFVSGGFQLTRFQAGVTSIVIALFCSMVMNQQ